jgi:hypothetical protein
VFIIGVPGNRLPPGLPISLFSCNKQPAVHGYKRFFG